MWPLAHSFPLLGLGGELEGKGKGCELVLRQFNRIAKEEKKIITIMLTKEYTE